MRQVGIAALTATADASANGPKIDANQLINASFQLVTADATAAGTIKVQACNDPVQVGTVRAQFTPVNWTDVPNATATVTAGVAPMIVLQNMSFGFIRVVFTRSAGAAEPLVVNMNAVGV